MNDKPPTVQAPIFPAVLVAVRKADQNNWEIGDAILAEIGYPGEDRFPTLLRQFSKESGLSYNWLYRRAHMARAFPPHKRRPGLTWQAHEKLPPDDDATERHGGSK